eukprot:gene8816-10342_t
MLIGTQGHLQKHRQSSAGDLAHGSDDRSSAVTERSFIIVACKLRAIVARASPLFAFSLSFEVALKPTVCLRDAQNRPYIDRNAYSGQYAKMVSYKPRCFDLPSLRAIQTNIDAGIVGRITEPPPIRKKSR